MKLRVSNLIHTGMDIEGLVLDYVIGDWWEII